MALIADAMSIKFRIQLKSDMMGQLCELYKNYLTCLDDFERYLDPLETLFMNSIAFDPDYKSLIYISQAELILQS